ncbi:DUF4082 domain-containing protein [Baekduia soli]|uniref:DUF4082 domain-containing protein n=1 Tax=Baekduia soli TaxID=496014 RepID=A0A5B8UA74_9ACTN|nr:Ig-like domain-containing protein [Baekduia soli]QEC50093.1 DUF4082 domain-containing protein [Baekduia soli]
MSGTTSYRVYRGTTAGAITTLVGSPTAATFTDTATNGTTYYYAVTAVSSGESGRSNTAQAKPLARTCGSGNAVVLENCVPGTASWKLTNAGRAYDNGIEGFATATSVNQGGSVDLKINTGPSGDNAPFHIDIYRMGWYGGTHGRLISTIPGQRGVAQPGCDEGAGNTGLIDCSAWTATTTVTTSTSWPSGVYWLKLVRDDNGSDNSILLIVRQDGSHSSAVFEVPTSSYQAYNPYGGKSLYTFNSNGATTVSGTTRAVKVSYDRPYAQSYNGENDFFPFADLPNVGFLERQGYDLTYLTDTDLHATASLAADHKALISGAHSEYWSSEMRNAITAARNAGTGLFFTGSNQIYWRIRFESSPFSGAANRVEVAYKTTESGVADPVSPTGTWRDPAGANAPENAIAGEQYIGDNDVHPFPLVVPAAQGANRIWRHTTAANQAAGGSVSFGSGLVGWEWNARAANGLEPAGTQTFAASPVTGNILQDAGRTYVAGSATQASTAYKAASGAWVVSTGTNYWARGLDVNDAGAGEPTLDIQQATTNILSDMGARPTTPIAGIVVDPATAPVLTGRSPSPDATGVATTSAVTATFDSDLDASTVNGTTFTLRTAAGSAVAATVAYDAATRTAKLTPSSPLGGNATYTATLKGGSAGIAGWGGTLASDVTWSFTTGAGTPPTVLSITPADGASSVPISTTVKVTFDRDMTASTITSSTVTLAPQLGTAVAASVTYDAASDTATLTPSAALDPTRQYTATVSTSVKGADGTAMAAPATSTFTTAAALTVTGKQPAPLATGVSTSTLVRAVFSRGVDATTLTGTTFTLTPSGGSAVAAAISYDATTNTATLTPASALTLGVTYTARLAGTIKASDGSVLGNDVSWTFTTATTATTAPAVTATTPAAGSATASTVAAITATFDRALDPASVTAQSFVLLDASNVTVAGTVAYDSTSRTASLTPTAALTPGASYTAQLTTAIRSSDGTPMANAVSWTFTTADCACSLMPSTLTPAMTGLDVADGRSGTGWTYEMGTRFYVDKSMRLTTLRFYKDAGETGTHIGRVWNASGTQVASVTFANESASGWQKAVLATPLSLTAGAIYTASVGLNSRFVMTEGGLSAQLSNGSLHSVVGANGVFASAAGSYPTSSWHTSNYFVDVVVTSAGSPVNTPSVTSRTPVSGATNVDPLTTVTATFGSGMDPASITASTFVLQTAGGSTVPATVSWNDATLTATLRPTTALSTGASYTARLTTGIRSDDGTALPAAVTWSFSTAIGAAPSVTATSPAAGATSVAIDQPVQATFSGSMDPSTITATTFSLTGPSGVVPATVTYDDPSRTATLTPTGPLSASTTYTATITTGVKSAVGTSMSTAKVWTFTTSACPCSLMSGLTPALTGLDVRDGRGGSGPWTYELGTKVAVTSAVSLTAIRFYKDAAETGTHVGTLWAPDGTVLAQTTFTGETASGWQQQALSTPVTLTPGVVYTVSVGFNTRFVMTQSGLGTRLVNGPLFSIDDGRNGVYAASAGVFPTGSYSSSNYFVDAVVR